eukprot:884407-Rhodomonas_salina.6
MLPDGRDARAREQQVRFSNCFDIANELATKRLIKPWYRFLGWFMSSEKELARAVLEMDSLVDATVQRRLVCSYRLRCGSGRSDIGHAANGCGVVTSGYAATRSMVLISGMLLQAAWYWHQACCYEQRCTDIGYAATSNVVLTSRMRVVVTSSMLLPARDRRGAGAEDRHPLAVSETTT